MIDPRFKAAVNHMRYCQTEFFKTKTYYAMENSKRAEKEVDRLIKEDDEAKSAQLKLYPEGQE